MSTLQEPKLRREPATPASGTGDGTYYGVPVIHRPHWKWLIIFYFFFGGIAGAAAVLAVIADLIAGRDGRLLGRVARYVSFAALVPSPVLLILDLGRPERFLNMLRIVKFRSPMSVGTWGLSLFGLLSTLVTARQAAVDGLLGRGRLRGHLLNLPQRGLGLATAPLGFFVAGYTGVLLAATAVPLWAKRGLLLGPLFLASAFSTATAAVAIPLALLAGPRDSALRRLARVQVVAIAAELTLHKLWLDGLGETAAPLRTGRTGEVLHRGTVQAGLVLPLCLHAIGRVVPGSLGRPLSLVGSGLVLSGGFCLRYAVVVGGRESADDPRATFEWTKRRE